MKQKIRDARIVINDNGTVYTASGSAHLDEISESATVARCVQQMAPLNARSYGLIEMRKIGASELPVGNSPGKAVFNYRAEVRQNTIWLMSFFFLGCIFGFAWTWFILVPKG